MFERIPDELRAVNQWHCWRYEKFKGEETKVPRQVSGDHAKSNDPSTWTDFETAADASQSYSGLAFEITEPWTGIDLDNCIGEDGIRSWAIEILFRFDGVGFAEISPSGNGIKIITRGKKPDGARCTHVFGPNKQQVECFDHARFWAITGDLYNGQDEIGDGQDAINWLCEKFLSKEKKTEQPVIPAMPPSKSGSLESRVESYLLSVSQASEGQRNQSAFQLAGHLRSFDHDGQRLTEDQVLEYCRQWNSKNSKPLSDDELEKAISSSGRNGTPRDVKLNRPLEAFRSRVDLSGILGPERSDDFDDEQFCVDAVPESGLLREIFDYYYQTSHRTSPVMGLAVAVSLCEMLFGRRIASHTDMRTNDYNVIMAPTASGKEACETTITKILQAAGSVPMLPPDVQSGNGLLKAIHSIPCGIWCCDEFGKMLESILNKKSNNGHAKQIGTHLLKLYSKSSGVYGGAAHADGIRNQVEQPHLVLLGLTTGQMFESIDSRQIQDGLFGRLAFWPVQNRPKRKTARAMQVPERLAMEVGQWLRWEPASGNLGNPLPIVLEMTGGAINRWDHHADAIDEKMEHESESRAAIWGRVAARAMKLALVHRAARLDMDCGTADWQFIRIELSDVDWGISVANWLARVACALIRENVVDTQANRARHVLETAVLKLGSVSRRDLMREFRSISGSEFTAAAESLQAEGRIEIGNEETSGRPRLVYKNPETQTA